MLYHGKAEIYSFLSQHLFSVPSQNPESPTALARVLGPRPEELAGVDALLASTLAYHSPQTSLHHPCFHGLASCLGFCL